MGFVERLDRFMTRNAPVKAVASQAVRPIASVTFDDFPKSAWTVGGPLLARYRARGTFYAAGSFAGRTVDDIAYYDGGDLKALVAAGHEIGCHGFAHQPAPTLSTTQMKADADCNANFLAPFLNGAALLSYAFPFGEASLRAKRYYARRFSNVRGVHPGINDGVMDLAQLRTTAIETCIWSEDAIAQAVDQAKTSRGWLVFHTHDVCDDPSPYGCTPAMLESVLKALALGGIEVLPMREALRVATGETA